MYHISLLCTASGQDSVAQAGIAYDAMSSTALSVSVGLICPRRDVRVRSNLAGHQGDPFYSSTHQARAVPDALHTSTCSMLGRNFKVYRSLLLSERRLVITSRAIRTFCLPFQMASSLQVYPSVLQS